MAIPVKVINYLKKNKIKYEIIEHRKVFTALDSAQTQKIKPLQVVKTLVMKLDKDYCLALLPASKNLDKAKFKKAVGNAQARSVHKIDFAKEPWMKKNLPGKVGATPAFGRMLELPVYMDGVLFKLKELILNTGDYTQSFKIKIKDFIKLEEPIKANFSKPKK